jgi:hypothetical protein
VHRLKSTYAISYSFSLDHIFARLGKLRKDFSEDGGKAVIAAHDRWRSGSTGLTNSKFFVATACQRRTRFLV